MSVSRVVIEEAWDQISGVIASTECNLQMVRWATLKARSFPTECRRGRLSIRIGCRSPLLEHLPIARENVLAHALVRAVG
jgi:hypothetical protein